MSTWVAPLGKIVLALLLCATASSAAIYYDGALTSTSQIRTAASNPFFGAGTVDVVGINFDYGAAGEVPTGGTLQGVGFDNINLTNPASTELPPLPGPYTLTHNAGGTLAVFMPFTGDNTVRTQTTGITGTDAATLNAVAKQMFYLSAGGSHGTAQLRLSGLNSSKNVYVQMIGGDAGWSGDVAVSANGTSVGTWTSVADGNGTTASLFAFDATTTADGKLTLDLAGALQYSGVSGLLVSAESSYAIPTPIPVKPVADNFDETLVVATQLLSAPFAGGNQILAGVNFHYPTANGGTTASGVTANGIGFDNVNILHNAQLSATGLPLTANTAGVTLDVREQWGSDERFQKPNTGDATLNQVLRDIGGVLSTGTDFEMTYHGLGANRNVFVQLLGGDGGWTGDIDVYLQGSSIAFGRWTSVADGSTYTPSIYGFSTVTDATGDLKLLLRGTGGYSGFSGAVVIGEVSSAVVPEPATFTLAGIGIAALIGCGRRK